MQEKPKASPSLGLEINSREIKVASITYQKRKASLSKLFSVPVERSSTELHVKPLYIGNQEAEFKKLAGKSLIVTVLSAKDVLIRPLTMQLTKERDIESVLEFQAEPLIPYSVEDALVDRVTIEKDKEGTRLSIVSTKIEQMSKHLEGWHSINIEPEVVGCVPQAMAAFSELFHKKEIPHIHINIGADVTTVALIDAQGKLLASQGIKGGSDDWVTYAERDSGKSENEALDLLKSANFTQQQPDVEFPTLHPLLNTFRLELTRVVFALRKYASGKNLADILITGEGGEFETVVRFIAGGLHMGLTQPEPSEEFSIPIATLQKFAVPIGAALTALPGAKEQINFRQKTFTYPNPWKRIKKPMAAYLALSVILAFSIYISGNAYISNKEDKIKKEYVDLLALMKKSYSDFERETRGKGAADEQMTEIPVISLSKPELQLRLNVLEKEIKATPDMFPLFPNVPSVSDVLAWLNSDPHIAEPQAPKGETPMIQLESFSYKMVKRPELSRNREHYQVKIELEFTTQTPRLAREFHDFLIAPNEMVDPSQDVKWSSERGRYRASFFLKDKTAYPSIR